MKDTKIGADSCAQALSFLVPASKDKLPLQTHGDILEETQRLIEEAELKLSFMEGGILQNRATVRPDTLSTVEEHHLLNEKKNKKLKQTLCNKMKKLEMQMEAKSKKQLTKSDATIASDDCGGISSAGHLTIQSHDERSEHMQQRHVRRPCRKSTEPDHDSQDLIDVVRTARDSVQGALAAARRLSASLNRTPRTSKDSVSGASGRLAAETQVADWECARPCAEHGNKRKVCSCLRPDFEGGKREEAKSDIREGREGASSVGAGNTTSKRNVGVFEANYTTTAKEQSRGPQKRLQTSVMPPISIKRSLEKQVMPVIEVPFPGSTPEAPRRDNIGVRNFKHVEPYSHPFARQSTFKEQVGKESGISSPQLPGQEDSVVDDDGNSCSDLNTSPSVGNVMEVQKERDVATRQLSRNTVVGEERRELSQSQVNEVLKFLIEKAAFSKKEATSSEKQPNRHEDKTELSNQLKAAESASSSTRSLLHTDQSGSGDDVGNISYNSLSRFLETYYKSAVATKRAKQKAAMRRKEEIRHMKEEEERFRSQVKVSSSESQKGEGVHNLIGPFKRAVRNGARKDITLRDVTSTSDQETLGIIPEINKKPDSAAPIAINGRTKINHALAPNEQPDQSDEVKGPSMNLTFSKIALEEIPSEGEEAERIDDLLQISQPSGSNFDGSPSGIAAEPSAHTENSNDDYEDDWEEENEEDKIIEDSVETRDVGDGSERDNQDETNDGVTHSLRTILEVEENSSHSMSLVHHEAPSHTVESGTNRSDTSQFSFPKASVLDIDIVKTPNLSQADDKRAQIDGGLSDAIRPREITFGKKSVSSELSRPILESVQPEIKNVRREGASEHQSSATSATDVKTEAKASEEFSSSRAFLEMTEALKKMLETVVSNLVQNKANHEKTLPGTSTDRHPSDVSPLHDPSYLSQRPNPKRLSVRFSGEPPPRHSFYDRRSSLRRYDPTSSGSANDDRVSSGSEASTKGTNSRYRNLRWRQPEVTKTSSNRARFKMGAKRSSATQTDDKNQPENRYQPDLTLNFPVVGELKCDAETQVTPVKDSKNMETEGWGRPISDDLLLRQSKLSLPRTSLRLPLRPLSLSFDMDPTERLLAFGRSNRAGPLSFGGILPEPIEHDRERTLCDSLSSSTSSLHPLDVLNHPVKNMSLSEGEVLAYHSCSCSEGELCPCAENTSKERYRPLGSSAEKIGPDERFPDCAHTSSKLPSHREFDMDSHTPRPSADSLLRENDVDLSDHLSEGEIIEKLIGISNLLYGEKERKSHSVERHGVLPNVGFQLKVD